MIGGVGVPPSTPPPDWWRRTSPPAMRPTLDLDDSVMARFREESARTDRTMSALVETALRRLLEARTPEIALPQRCHTLLERWRRQSGARY